MVVAYTLLEARLDPLSQWRLQQTLKVFSLRTSSFPAGRGNKETRAPYIQKDITLTSPYWESFTIS